MCSRVNYTQENYDPKQPVCNNQDDFNQAFQQALKETAKDDLKKNRTYLIVYMVLWVIFFLWALFLAMQVPPGDGRTIHLVFAMLASPVYVLSHYLSMFQTKGSMGCGAMMPMGGVY